MTKWTSDKIDKHRWTNEELHKKIKNAKSIDDVAELIFNITHPKYYRNFYVPGINIEHPEDLVEETYFSTGDYNIKNTIRRTLEKLIIEWRNEDKNSVDHLKVYSNTIIRIGAPQSTPLYEWFLEKAKDESFKKISPQYSPNPLHLSILAGLFFYVYPESGSGAMNLRDIKKIIKRDIKEYPYHNACFNKAWQIDYNFADKLIPTYYKVAVANDDKEMFNSEVEQYIRARGDIDKNYIRKKIGEEYNKNKPIQEQEANKNKPL